MNINITHYKQEQSNESNSFRKFTLQSSVTKNLCIIVVVVVGGGGSGGGGGGTSLKLIVFKASYDKF